METAAQRRDRFLTLVASKAAFYNRRHDRNVTHARTAHALDVRTAVARLESRMAAAEYLRDLDLRLRQSKATLTVERAAAVVESQRLASYVSPMLGAARIKIVQEMASERRAGFLNEIAERAHSSVRRAVLTCATADVRAREHAEALRANLEDRLAAAADRKEDLLATNVNALAGGGPPCASSPSPKRPASATRAKRADLIEGVSSVGRTVFRPPSPGGPYSPETRAAARVKRGEGVSRSAPTSPAGA